MANLSNYAEEVVLNTFLRTTPTFLSLHTAAGASESTAAWAATEIPNSNNYSRTTVGTGLWTDPAGVGFCTTNAVITTAIASGAWGTITHLGLWTSGTYGGGNLIVWFQMPGTGKIVSAGNALNIDAGNMTVTAQ